MHLFWLLLFGSIALFWLTRGMRVAYGAIRLPWLNNFAPASNAECPRISILFAARDEEEKLPAALVTLMELDYPELEVIAGDDRSKDSTGRILDEFAAAHPRLHVVHVAKLPAGGSANLMRFKKHMKLRKANGCFLRMRMCASIRMPCVALLLSQRRETSITSRCLAKSR